VDRVRVGVSVKEPCFEDFRSFRQPFLCVQDALVKDAALSWCRDGFLRAELLWSTKSVCHVLLTIDILSNVVSIMMLMSDTGVYTRAPGWKLCVPSVPTTVSDPMIGSSRRCRLFADMFEVSGVGIVRSCDLSVA
jgi:hypothetical protein